MPVAAARLAGLSLVRFREDYLPGAVDAEALARNDRNIEERLAAMKMIATVEDPMPTIVGVLVLGRRPQEFLPGAYAQFLRIAGTEWGIRSSTKLVAFGPISEVIAQLDLKLFAHNRTAVDFTSDRLEKRTVTYPPSALQQLVRNAVMHRSYEGTNAPIHVYWFDDRIEINSPGGGAYGELNHRNFGQPGLVDYRNPILAEAMRVLGFFQRFGFGIPSARRDLQTNGNPPPEFRVEANRIRCTVRVRAPEPARSSR